MVNQPLRIALALFFAFSSSSLVGCGGDDGTGDSETGESAEGAETAEGPTCSGADATRIQTILALTSDQTAGADVFSSTCGTASCHGADGNSGSASSLSDDIPDYTPDSLACLLLMGTGAMPSLAGLTDQQLADVIAYVDATF